jgi:hypothetical protein
MMPHFTRRLPRQKGKLKPKLILRRIVRAPSGHRSRAQLQLLHLNINPHRCLVHNRHRSQVQLLHLNPRRGRAQLLHLNPHRSLVNSRHHSPRSNMCGGIVGVGTSTSSSQHKKIARRPHPPRPQRSLLKRRKASVSLMRMLSVYLLMTMYYLEEEALSISILAILHFARRLLDSVQCIKEVRRREIPHFPDTC